MKKSFVSILFVLIFGSFSFGQEPSPTPPTGSGTGQGSGNGTGIGSGSGSGVSEPAVATSGKTAGIIIKSKPRANFTDLARENGTEGLVRLRVTFLASGEIGAISPVLSLPDGLTEQAIVAARKLKFEPAMRNGVPYTVTKQVEYSFSFYYGENDKSLKQNAEILEMPEAEHPTESNLQNIGGKVKVSLILISDGKAEIVQINTDLPKEFEEKAREAASKIKFNPAIHKNGKAVSQRKEIEYEFKAQKD